MLPWFVHVTRCPGWIRMTVGLKHADTRSTFTPRATLNYPPWHPPPAIAAGAPSESAMKRNTTAAHARLPMAWLLSRFAHLLRRSNGGGSRSADRPGDPERLGLAGVCL